jgi:hypothetical protein
MLHIFAQALLLATRMDIASPARRQDARDTGGTRRRMPLNG